MIGCVESAAFPLFRTLLFAPFATEAMFRGDRAAHVLFPQSGFAFSGFLFYAQMSLPSEVKRADKPNTGHVSIVQLFLAMLNTENS